MTLPNFLIIGAPKAGTTSLYDYFRAHPDIFMPQIKEPKFFVYEGSGSRQKFPIQSQEEYEALFEGVKGESAIGEATPHYIAYSSAARRIHELIPQARLIASLRNPVDRSFSVYQMNMRNRGVNRGVPFLEAMEVDQNLRETYADKLKAYFELFSREQMRIILLDELKAEPRRTVQSLFEFLGVDPGFEPDLTKVSNPGGEPKIKFLHSLLSNPKIRKAGRSLLPEAAIEKARDLRSQNLQKSGLDPEERRQAAGLFREDIERTQELIGRDLSHWLET